MHRVIIVGGGFGGLYAARTLGRAPVEVTMIDRRNHHLFQPLLYQVATGGLSPANIAAPLRNILRKQQNCRVFLGEVIGFDAQARQVVLADEQRLSYDTLIVATGSRHSYFGHQEWAQYAPGLKSLDDATAIRRRILLAFELAERATDPAEIRRLLTFVIVGAGPTGVELAGAIAEISRQTLRSEFRHIDPASARVLLIENSNRVLQVYPEDLSTAAKEGLVKTGVEVHTDTSVTAIDEGGVTVQKEHGSEYIECPNVFWAAGVQASALGKVIAHAFGAALERNGKVRVEPDFSVPGHSNVFVIGDLAHYVPANQPPLPALAPVAMQAGEYVAQLIRARVRQSALPKPFHYKDYGTMATIGRRSAVADLRGRHLTGALAWYAWLFVHLMQLVGHESRVLVLIQWGWHYFTRNRSARLITGDDIRRESTEHPFQRDGNAIAIDKIPEESPVR